MSPSRRASSVPAVEDALLARLAARAGLAGVFVLLGLPTEVPTKRERVYLIGVQENERQPRVQQGARRETYIIPAIIEVHGVTGRDRNAVRDRFWEIVEEIEDELADDPELGDIADDSCVEQIVEMNVLPATDGYIAKGLLHIRVNGVV